jgi:hypothetical protein
LTAEETYVEFLMLVEQNATNNNISTDKPRFVKLFNSSYISFVEGVWAKKNEIDIRNISHLLVPNKDLNKIGNSDEYSKFKLPSDYFTTASLSAYASKDSCKNERIFTFEIKPDDRDEVYQDSNNEPSFEYRETFYHFSENNSVVIYRKDFDISKVTLDYYRYPKKLDLAGFEDENGNHTQNIDPEGDDKIIRKILLSMARTFSANNRDVTGYQIDQQRLFTNK